MSETWYRVSRGVAQGHPATIEKMVVLRSTAKFLVLKMSYGNRDERKESINSKWYCTFRKRAEAVRHVEQGLSARIRHARAKQEAGIRDEREAVESLSRWRRLESIEPGEGTIGA